MVMVVVPVAVALALITMVVGVLETTVAPPATPVPETANPGTIWRMPPVIAMTLLPLVVVPVNAKGTESLMPKPSRK